MGVKKLTEVCSPKQWKTISQTEMLPEGYPVYGANGIIGYYNEYNHENPTVLITCRGATCGTLNISKPFSYVNGNAMALDNVIEDVDEKYLYYYLQSRGLKDIISGSAQPQITIQNLTKVIVSYPSIEEQKRIVSMLDKADEIRAKKKLANDKLDEFLKSTFISMFGDPVNCTKGFDTKHFADICKNIFGGGTPSKAHPEYYIGEIPWVTPKDMKTLIINSSIDYINENAVANSSTKLIPVNSLLMVIRSGILKHTLPVAINKVEVTLNQDMKAFVLNEELANVYFVLYQLKLLEKIILKNVRSVTADNIEFNLIKNLELNVPPLELQNKFAQIVEHVDAQKQKNELVIEQMNNLFNSLSQRAFKGEI